MRRIWVAVTATVAVVLVGAGAWAVADRRADDPHGDAGTPSSTASATPTSTPSRSSSPTTAATPSAPAASPAAPADPSPSAPAPTATAAAPAEPGAVDVIVTYADPAPGTGDLEVGAYAAAVDAGGTCTLTATAGGKTVSASIPATPDVSTTSCGGLTVGHDKLGSGTWQVTVTYVSPTLAGTSAPVQVTLP